MEAVDAIEDVGAREVHKSSISECGVLGGECFESVVTDGQQHDLGIAQDERR